MHSSAMWSHMQGLCHGRDHGFQWIPSHDKKEDWTPCEALQGHVDLCRQLNTTADAKATHMAERQLARSSSLQQAWDNACSWELQAMRHQHRVMRMLRDRYDAELALQSTQTQPSSQQDQFQPPQPPRRRKLMPNQHDSTTTTVDATAAPQQPSATAAVPQQQFDATAATQISALPPSARDGAAHVLAPPVMSTQQQATASTQHGLRQLQQQPHRSHCSRPPEQPSSHASTGNHTLQGNSQQQQPSHCEHSQQQQLSSHNEGPQYEQQHPKRRRVLHKQPPTSLSN